MASWPHERNRNQSRERGVVTQAIIEEGLKSRDYDSVRRVLPNMNPVDIAGELERLDPGEAVLVFRLLSKNHATRVFEQLTLESQHRLLVSFSTDAAQVLFNSLSPDDRTRLLEEVPAMVAKRLIQELDPWERQVAIALLGYPENSAGRWMTPDFVSLRHDMTADQALERVRKIGLHKETVYTCYILDDERHLIGTVSLREVVLAAANTKVHAIMNAQPKYVQTDTDREQVAKVMGAYDLVAVPVVDHEERLVGIITHDDVLDIVEAEATEDIYHLGAVPQAERAYFSTNVFMRARRRASWLVFLILVNTVTGFIIAGQSELLTQVAILAAFIPLLIGTGGNIGSQSSTVVVRGLVIGEIHKGRVVTTMLREGSVGAILGLALGVIAFIWSMVLSGGNIHVGIVVSITLIAIATGATLVGSGLPFLFRALRVDPALASAPLVTTFMDLFGVSVYFLVARLLLTL
ncbi:MAG: magnesium transporter [Dehalococcoidia bacterium]|nr:magnesium transporter [Dehalococcoidia bacterium]